MTFSALLVLLCSAANAALTQDSDSLTVRYDVEGLTVIHRIVPDSRVTAINLYLLGGARQISQRDAGIEPLLLRVSEHGTRRYPGPAARAALARTGGSLFVSPEADWTVVGMRALSETFDSTWVVFADRIMHPTLDSAAVEIERAKMIASAKARMSNPDERVRILAERAAFGGHVYAPDVRGTETSLGQITIADLETYLARHFVSSRMLLVVVGNVPADRVRAAVRETLAALPAGDYKWELPPLWPANDPSVTVAYEAIPTKYVVGYFSGPAASSEEHAAFRVAVVTLSSMIARGASEKGLSYAAGALLLDRAASGGAIYFSTDFPKECVDLANRSIQQLQDYEFTRATLREYAQSSTIEYFLGSETVGQLADVIGRGFLFRGALPSPEEHVARLMNVSPTDIKRAARDYFKNIQYAFLGDTTDVPRRAMRRH